MSRVNVSELKAIADQYNAYFEAIKQCFVGRDQVIDLLKYALAQHQHMLIFGPPGTSKTAICDIALGGITGASKFVVELSMFLGEDAIFGPYDTKKMREEGILEHRTEGMLPEAQFARIGEFLDGNMALLRALLGSLHERRLRRGRQIVDMPLLSVYCDTNHDPGEFLKKNPHVWAVLDRLMFIASVGYLEDDGQIAEMLKRFQTGKTTRLGKLLPLEVVQKISELVVNPPSLIQDQLIFAKLGQAFGEYRRQRQAMIQSNTITPVLPKMTDRRFCYASQMLEVAAALDGRIHVIPEDMVHCQYVLGTTEAEFQLWENIAWVKIEEIKEEHSQQLDHAQMVAVSAILEQAEQLDPNGDLDDSIQTLRILEEQVKGIVPENDLVAEKQTQAGVRLAEIREALEKKVLERSGLA